MTKVRKPCNRKAQVARASAALIRNNYSAIANVEPGNIQIMLNWKTCKQIKNVLIADALCDIAHYWTVYISVFCQRQDGMQYSKSCQFQPPGLRMAAGLEQTMIDKHAELVAENNQNHIIGSGWIIIPDVIDMDEDDANEVFKAMGVWQRAPAA